jgi:tRNA pseudouridine55 synthase
MDGVLLIDKPAGLTSHDVVARLRRSSGERAIGHTGTLDPRATGLLPLVCGRATRLASLLTGKDKTYEASIRLGFPTDTDDADGNPIADPRPVPADDAAIEQALMTFTGTFDQRPPAHSAKKVGGEKAYERARRDDPIDLPPVPVTVRSIVWRGRDGDLIHVSVTAAAGFYVRALARDLGARLGSGGHLSELRRTRSGAFDLTAAVAFDEAERLGRDVASRALSPRDALPDLLEVSLTDPGLKRALHGNPLGPEHLEARWLPPPTGAGPVKLLAGDGRLVALAHSRGGALHPVVVLG